MAATVSDLANGVGTTSTTTVVTGATVTGAVASRDWFVVVVAGDNNGSAGVASLTTVVDSGASNVYTNRALINYDPGAAAAGATLGIYTCPVTADITNGTITANFSPATVAKAIQVYRVRPATGEVVSFIAADATGVTGSATSHAAATVSVTIGDIIFGATAIETNTAVTGDTDTTNGSWSAVVTRLANVSATDLSSITSSSQYKTVTATGNQDWACTTAAAKDSARSYLVLRSVAKSIIADLGTYALTGTDASPEYGRVVAADAGSYALTGTDAAPEHGWLITAATGSYALTGADATTRKTWVIYAELG